MEADRQIGWIKGRCIGKGSFGTVSLAYDKLHGHVFAIKSVPLSPTASPNDHSMSSLENEIDILRSLHSPFVVSFLGDSTTLTHRNLHLEFVPGGTLAHSAGCLCERDVRAYARQITRALFYLHTVAGIVHSDVKGRNVLAGPSPGSAKLADFGSARRVSGQRGAIGGTPLWMAPEVVRGGTPTPESDIWSLGCTVIEMITGAHPWKQNATANALFEIGYSDKLPEFPSNLSKSGIDFLSKCLCRGPEERWTAEQLLQHQFLDGDDADVEDTESGRSPRSVLEWAHHEFNEVADEDEEGNAEPTVAVSERIRELADGGAGGEDVSWESEGWETVRENCLWEASGGGASSETSSGGDCKESIGCQRVEMDQMAMNERGRGFCLILLCCNAVAVDAIANPLLFTLVLHLFRLYRFVQLRFLSF